MNKRSLKQVRLDYYRQAVAEFGDEVRNATWRLIDDWSGYMVSDDGRILSFKYSKPVFMNLYDVDGYRQVVLSRPGEQKSILVHRLVAFAFIGNDDKVGKWQVNHKNGRKDDNRKSNLEWVSPRENILHSRDTGLHSGGATKRAINKTPHWERVGSTQIYKITDRDYNHICDIAGVGDLETYFRASITTLEKDYIDSGYPIDGQFIERAGTVSEEYAAERWIRNNIKRRKQ